jgi:hypothetical protein
MTPRTSPIPAASTFFYGSPDRRRRSAGRRQSKRPSPQPERRPQRAQAWKASAVGASESTQWSRKAPLCAAFARRLRGSRGRQAQRQGRASSPVDKDYRAPQVRPEPPS